MVSLDDMVTDALVEVSAGSEQEQSASISQSSGVVRLVRKIIEDARRLGAHEFLLSSAPGALDAAKNRFDFLLDSVSAPHDLATYAGLLRTDGVMVLLGIPETPATLPAFPLIGRRRSIAGSLIGGVAETQEMLDFCADRGILSDVETIAVDAINGAYERMLEGDVRYRFVIDTRTLG